MSLAVEDLRLEGVECRRLISLGRVLDKLKLNLHLLLTDKPLADLWAFVGRGREEG